MFWNLRYLHFWGTNCQLKGQYLNCFRKWSANRQWKRAWLRSKTIPNDYQAEYTLQMSYWLSLICLFTHLSDLIKTSHKILSPKPELVIQVHLQWWHQKTRAFETAHSFQPWFQLLFVLKKKFFPRTSTRSECWTWRHVVLSTKQRWIPTPVFPGVRMAAARSARNKGSQRHQWSLGPMDCLFVALFMIIDVWIENWCLDKWSYLNCH